MYKANWRAVKKDIYKSDYKENNLSHDHEKSLIFL